MADWQVLYWWIDGLPDWQIGRLEDRQIGRFCIGGLTDQRIGGFCIGGLFDRRIGRSVLYLNCLLTMVEGHEAEFLGRLSFLLSIYW